MEVMEPVLPKSSFHCSINCKHHPEETFLSICMEKICKKRYELCCQKCSEEKHVNHSLLSLQTFLEAYNNEREKYFEGLDSQIQKLIESYENIDKDFTRAISNISQARDLLKNSVQSFKTEFSLFEDEIHTVEAILSNIKRNNLSYDEIQQFLDQQVEKSSFYCSFKDINKSNKFQIHAKQFLAYFNEQSGDAYKIFGQQARQEGMIMNLKSLNGSAELLKNQARILLTSKQDFSFLNKQIQKGSYVDEYDKIEIKELASKQWNDLQNILETAKEDFLQSMPQIDFTIGQFLLPQFLLITNSLIQNLLNFCQKIQIFLSRLIRKNRLFLYQKITRNSKALGSIQNSNLIFQIQIFIIKIEDCVQNPYNLIQKTKLNQMFQKIYVYNLIYDLFLYQKQNSFQQFEDGSLTEVLNESQQKLENLEILQQSGQHLEQSTRKLLESLQLTSLKKLKLDINFQKPQMHNEILKLISENHWLEDINLNLNMPDKNRPKIKDYLSAIAPNQILKKLKLNFSCLNNPPYICQDTLKLVDQFFENNKEIQVFILGQNIEQYQI